MIFLRGVRYYFSAKMIFMGGLLDIIFSIFGEPPFVYHFSMEIIWGGPVLYIFIGDSRVVSAHFSVFFLYFCWGPHSQTISKDFWLCIIFRTTQGLVQSADEDEIDLDVDLVQIRTEPSPTRTHAFNRTTSIQTEPSPMRIRFITRSCEMR